MQPNCQLPSFYFGLNFLDNGVGWLVRPKVWDKIHSMFLGHMCYVVYFISLYQILICVMKMMRIYWLSAEVFQPRTAAAEGQSHRAG